MSKFKDPKVRFFSLSSLQTSRGGFLLAESALFTLLSLLNFADSAALQLAIAFFFFSLSRFSTLLTFVFRSFFRQGTRQPYAKPRNSGEDTPAAFLRRERQGRGSISSPSSRSKSSTPRSASITSYHCYQYPLRRHVRKPWTKHSAKKDQEARLLRSASTAGFFCSLAMETNRRDRQASNPEPLRQSLHHWHSSESALSIEGIPPRFSSKLNDSKGASRRRRSRCPHRAKKKHSITAKHIVKDKGKRMWGGVIRYVIVEDSGSLSRIFVVLS